MKSGKISFAFTVNSCKNCPHKKDCITAKSAKRKRIILTKNIELHKKQNEFEESKYFKERYHHRPIIEGKNAELKGNFSSFYMLFSMDTKEATFNSIYIIFLSQLTNLLYTLYIGNIPDFELSNLIVMIIGGISGGIVGGEILRRITVTYINRIFNALLVLIIIICIFIVWRCF